MKKSARRRSRFSMLRKTVIGLLLLMFTTSFLLMPSAFANVDASSSVLSATSFTADENGNVTISWGAAALEGEHLALFAGGAVAAYAPPEGDGRSATVPLAPDAEALSKTYYAGLTTLSKDDLAVYAAVPDGTGESYTFGPEENPTTFVLITVEFPASYGAGDGGDGGDDESGDATTPGGGAGEDGDGGEEGEEGPGDSEIKPLDWSFIGMASDNADPTRAEAGNVLTITLQTNKDTITVTDDPFASDGVTFLSAGTPVADPLDPSLYTLTINYTVTGAPAGGGAFGFGFSLTDDAHPTAAPIVITSADFTGGSTVTFLAPLPTTLGITSLTFAKTVDSGGGTVHPGFAKTGDTVTVSFDSPSSLLTLDTSASNTIAGQAVATLPRPTLNPVTGDWTYTIDVQLPTTHSQPDNSAITFSLTIASGTSSDTLTDAMTTSRVFYLGALSIVGSARSSATMPDGSAVPYNWATDGDTFALSFTTNHPAIYDATAGAIFKTSGASIPLTGITSSGAAITSHSITYDLNSDGLDIYKQIVMEVPMVDLAGNPYTVVFGDYSGDTILYVPTPGPTNTPQIASITLSRPNRPGTSVKKGNSVTFSYTDTSARPGQTLSVSMGGVTTPLTPFGDPDNTGKVTYTATFTVESGTDNTALSYAVYSSDSTAPSPYFSYAPGDVGPERPSPVLVYLDDIKIVNVTMQSQEPRTVFTDNAGYAQNGSIIELSITTNHPVDDPTLVPGNVTIAGDSSSITASQHRTIPNTWILSYTLPSTPAAGSTLVDNAAIDFVIGDISDSAGQHTGAISYATLPAGGGLAPFGPLVDQSKATVIYYAPLSISATVQNATTAKNLDAAKDGDALTVTFTTTHPLDAIPATSTGSLAVRDIAAGDPAGINYEILLNGTVLSGSLVEKATPNEIKDTSGSVPLYVYTFTYTLPANALVAGYTDLDVIDVNIDVADRFSSVAYSTATDPAYTAPVTYYAPLTFSGVTVHSNNSEDGTKYAKEGDVITVEFVTNHMINLATSSGSVLAQGGLTLTSSSSGTYHWRFTSGALKDGDLADLAFVDFAFSIEDPAGNTARQASGASPIKYYAKIVATFNIASNNARTTWAKNGDTVTVSAKSNHETSVKVSTIAGRMGTPHGNLTMSPSASYLIPGGEGTIAEGLLTFSVTLTDPAGNVMTGTKTGGTEVTYDRTLPTVVLLPVYTGFSNKDISFVVMYTDDHIDPNAVSFLMNDMEQLGGADRALAGISKVFTKAIVLEQDNEYRLRGTVSDMAGNRCALDATAVVTLDKTRPVIKVLLDNNTFISGTSPSQIFSIEDLNIKDIVCSITDDSGVNEWDLSEPLVTEGKKTVFLTAEDMAGNTAVPLSYDIYIDDTAPKPAVQDSVSGTELSAEGVTELKGSSAILSVELAAIHMGDEEPDHFTRLQLLDESGNVLTDALAGAGSAQGPFILELPEHGTYTLVLEATDDVGNETGRLEYKIEFSKEGLISILTDPADPISGGTSRSALFYWLVIGLPVVAAALLGGVFLRKRFGKTAKKARQEK